MNKKQLAKLVEEAQELLKKNDSLQSSEKLYKVAEECIKLLAIANNMAEPNKRRWNTEELNGLAYALTAIYGQDLYSNWKIALDDLHRKGFHEYDLTTIDVFNRIHNVTELMDLI